MALITDSHHWQYFLALENDLINLSRYIEFKGVTDTNSENAKVYSIELVKILFAACAECENVGKILANITNGNILDISDEIIQNPTKPEYDKLPTQEILCPVYDLTFTPWQEWSQSKRPTDPSNSSSRIAYPNPQWWIDHNDVKHHRISDYKRANLLNTLNAVAGLMCLLLHGMKKVHDSSGKKKVKISPLLAPKLFTVSNAGLGGFGSTDWVWTED